MRKVQLVYVKSYLDYPTWKDTFSTLVEVDEPKAFENDPVHLIAVRTFAAGDGPSNASIQHPLEGDSNAIILESKDFSSLLGKLLTQIDATFGDTDQRKAQKDLVKGMIWDWEKGLRERAVQTVDSHKESIDSVK